MWDQQGHAVSKIVQPEDSSLASIVRPCWAVALCTVRVNSGVVRARHTSWAPAMGRLSILFGRSSSPPDQGLLV